MKVIYKNWEKAIFFTLIGGLLVIMLFCIRKGADYKRHISRRIAGLAQGEVNRHRWLIPGEGDYESFLEKIKKGPAVFYLSKSGRNIFTTFGKESGYESVRPGTSAFKIFEIDYKPLEIEYRGRIVFGNGRIVAQVSFHNRTYLVGVGAKVARYKVTHLDKDYIKLQSDKAEVIKIGYQKKTYSEELMAKVKELNSQRILQVSEGSEFFGGKVLDIDKDYVLVSKQGQLIRLEKGMVYK